MTDDSTSVNSTHQSRTTLLCLLVLAVYQVGSTLWGGMHWHSTIPFWDMWDGTLDFYMKTLQGDTAIWWSQHNEHRIVIARLMFWIDQTLFAGLGKSLVFFNYLAAAVSVATFTLLARDLADQSIAARHLIAWAALFSVLLFSWMQENNFTWGFQVQFFLACLLPLAAFRLLARSADQTNTATPTFFLACFIGVLSAGTMANGLAALPLMVLIGWLLGFSWQRQLVLVLLSAGVLFAYLGDYRRPPYHGSVAESLLADPAGVLVFAFTYIGSPAYFWLWKSGSAIWVAFGFGVAVTLTALWLSLDALRRTPRSPAAMALVAFLVYVGATAFATAGGRLPFGLEMAVSSRYTTPALMAWCSALLLLANKLQYVKSPLRCFGGLASKVAGMICILLIGAAQAGAFGSSYDRHKVHEVGALAIGLGVRDPEYIGHLYPNADIALEIGARANSLRLGWFGTPLALSLLAPRPRTLTASVPKGCSVNVIEIDPIADQTAFVRVRGVADPAWRPNALIFRDSAGVVVGAAIGQASLASDIVPEGTPPKSGFIGYIRRSATGNPLWATDPNVHCETEIHIPRMLVQLRSVPMDEELSDHRLVGSDQVVSRTISKGGDFGHSIIPGYAVIGSWVQSDEDVGSLTIRMQPGQVFFYRNGPGHGKQFLRIKELGTELPMPRVPKWTAVNLDTGMTGYPVELELIDAGQGWGQWSAVAVRANRSHP